MGNTIKNGYCLVLSGGGTKGVYHVGVWKALKELGIQVNALVGNSIGAIVAAFIAQGLDETLYQLAEEIGLDYVLNIPSEFIENGELKLNLMDQKALKRFYESLLTKDGLNTSPLRNLLCSHLDEEVIRRQNIDLGLITYNTSIRKPEEIFLDSMENGELIDYIMASSAVPGFTRPEIKGNRYIDGGVYDNIPFAMAKNRGYKSIIVSDISGMGVRRKMAIEGTKTVYIKNSIDLGGYFNFDKTFLHQFTQLGYMDTLQIFGKLEGRKFFLQPVANGTINYMEEICSKLANNRQILPKKHRHARNILSIFTDCAAEILSLERIKIWTYQEIFKNILERSREIQKLVNELGTNELRQTRKTVRRAINKKKLLRNAYFYYSLSDRHLSPKLNRMLNHLLEDLFPEIPAGVFLINLLEESVDF